MSKTLLPHFAYICLAAMFAIGGFIWGRHPIRNANSDALQRAASDPKIAEAAQAMNTLKAWGDEVRNNVAKAEAAAKANAMARSTAQDFLQSGDVQIRAAGIYRGPLHAQQFSLNQAPQLLDHDCLVVVYTVENISKTTMLTASAQTAFDSFDNKLEAETNADYSDILNTLGVPKLQDGEIAPGERHVACEVFKQPLPNASWFVLLMRVSKANGESAELGYLKEPASMHIDTEALKTDTEHHPSTRIGGASAETRPEQTKAEAEAKKQASASDTLTTSDVRIHVAKVYRGPLARNRIGFLNSDSEHLPLDHDCLLVGYTIENLSKTTMLDAAAFEEVDNFGNKLEPEEQADFPDIIRHLGLDKYDTDKFAPGESRMRYSVYAKPLPNAEWYILKMFVKKANGDLSEVGYAKASNQ